MWSVSISKATGPPLIPCLAKFSSTTWRSFLSAVRLHCICSLRDGRRSKMRCRFAPVSPKSSTRITRTKAFEQGGLSPWVTIVQFTHRNYCTNKVLSMETVHENSLLSVQEDVIRFVPEGCGASPLRAIDSNGAYGQHSGSSYLTATSKKMRYQRTHL